MNILRGEVWVATLDPTRGHEQAGTRPVLVLTEDLYNQGPAGLVMALPITSTRRTLPHHILVTPPEGGLTIPSSILCDGLRSLAKDRFLRKLGNILPTTLRQVEQVLMILLGLPGNVIPGSSPPSRS